jgi:hypothetical protein
MTKHLMRLAGILILIAIAGSALWSFFPRTEDDPKTPRIIEKGPNIDFVVGITAFSIGVVTFFGVAGLNRSVKNQQVLKGERLRTSIACSLVLSYLFMVSFTTFVGNSPIAGEVTQKFVESFSSVIGITIAFYFGTSAATQIFGKETDKQPESKSDDKDS